MPERPQAPGYLANLMARLFHDVSGEGLRPLGIRPEQFPVLVALWFSSGVTRESLLAALETEPEDADALVVTLVADGLVVESPADSAAPLLLTATAAAARDAAVLAARRANAAAASALSETEMVQFVSMMNRVIDALQAARSS